jgi:hypothetical protein
MKHVFVFFIFSLSTLGVLGLPSTSQAQSLAFENDWSRAYIQSIDSATTMTALSSYSEFKVGEVLVIQSRDAHQQIIGFVEVKSIEVQPGGRYVVKARLVRHTRSAMIQIGDILYRMDFNTYHEEYKGTTELIIKNENIQSSASYKPLVFMGLSAGETAQTLNDNEVLINFIGYLDYGYNPKFTIGTLVPANILSAPNAHAKYKFSESDSNVFSFGANYFQSTAKTEGTLNLTLYWDSVSSESLIGHTNLSVALATIDNAKSLTALKGTGTSSFQSGYEFVLDDWNRVLIGPSFNFENKSVGGYMSYLWVWDHFHALAGFSTTNITRTVVSVEDGYYFNADFFWRF